MPEPTRIVIVGAGISGLATAFWLQERLPSAEITVLESAPRIGGAIWTERTDGYLIESGPTSFLGNEVSTLRLCNKLGISGQILDPEPAYERRYVFHESQMQRLPTSFWGMMTSAQFGFGSVFRLVTERFRPKAIDKKDESIFQFAERRIGTELAEFISEIAATDLYAGDPKLLSIRSCFPNYAKAEREYGSVMGGLSRLLKLQRDNAVKSGDPAPYGKPVPLTFKDGMRVLVETLGSKLKAPPLVNRAARAVGLESNNGVHRWRVQGEEGHSWPADAVVLAGPSPRQAGLIADLDPDLADALLAIQFSPLVSLHLGYRREHVPVQLDSAGFIVPQRLKREVLKVDFLSSLYTGRAPTEHVLLRVLCGGWQRKEIAHWEEDALVQVIRRELKQLMKIVRPPEFLRIHRWLHAVPQYMLGHGDRVGNIDRLAAQHPGLFLGGNAFHGAAINDMTIRAERLAQKVHHFFKDKRPSQSLR